MKEMSYAEFEKLKTYPITWHIVRNVGVGICGKTLGVFKVTTQGLSMAIIRDIYVSDDECEEGQRCLNTSCPLNHVDDETWLMLIGYKRPKATKIWKDGKLQETKEKIQKYGEWVRK